MDFIKWVHQGIQGQHINIKIHWVQVSVCAHKELFFLKKIDSIKEDKNNT